MKIFTWQIAIFIKRDYKKGTKQFLLVYMILQITIKIFLHFFLASIRMSGKSINFDDKKINKINFSKNKKLFSLNDIDANKILVL